MNHIQQLTEGIRHRHFRSLARALTWVENGREEGAAFLRDLDIPPGTPVIGITGPPGAGKSTLVDALAAELVAAGKEVAILAVDPSSPFHQGALLGDRIRMSSHYNNEQVYIRSVATRGALGGVAGKTLEMCDVLKAFGFGYILVETAGVGQSEVEIASLADCTVVVLVPESGDEIQSLKSGLMEIADIFVVNKSDREGARELAITLRQMLHGRETDIWKVPVEQAVATKNRGIVEIVAHIERFSRLEKPGRSAALLAGKAWHLISGRRMQDVNKEELTREIARESRQDGFNIYRFIEEHY